MLYLSCFLLMINSHYFTSHQVESVQARLDDVLADLQEIKDRVKKQQPIPIREEPIAEEIVKVRNWLRAISIGEWLKNF